LTAPHSFVDNVINAVEQGGYDTDGVFFSSFASGLSVLNQDQIKKGVILIEIGSKTTNILFFKDQTLRDFIAIPFGGDEITQDISKDLNIPWDLAEDLKKSYLVLSSQEGRNSDNIVIKNAESYTTIQRSRILEITKPKIDNFLVRLKEIFDSRMHKEAIKCGAIAVGGCSYLEGLLERIEETIGMPVWLGRVNIQSCSGRSISTEYAAAVGLVFHYTNFSNKSYLRKSFQGVTPFRKTANFLHQLYHDYF